MQVKQLDDFGERLRRCILDEHPSPRRSAAVDQVNVARLRLFLYRCFARVQQTRRGRHPFASIFPSRKIHRRDAHAIFAPSNRRFFDWLMPSAPALCREAGQLTPRSAALFRGFGAPIFTHAIKSAICLSAQLLSLGRHL
jgi:hypothetical protein